MLAICTIKNPYHSFCKIMMNTISENRTVVTLNMPCATKDNFYGTKPDCTFNNLQKLSCLIS